jgi:hypothetical protein
MVRHFLATLMLCLSLTPAVAQEEDGPSMMERGAQEFLEGLMKQMEPAWREMQDFMEEMGPALIELMEEIKDWSVYEPPEILENGDIIIRLKPSEEDDTQPAPDPEPLPQIEL